MKGVDEMARALERARDSVRGQLAAALYQEAERVMADSKDNYVPVDFGVLRSSGRVDPPTWDGDTVTVVISYGGAAIAYALAVHEHLSKHSPYSWQVAKRVTFHPAGHGPKYLEKPLNKHSKGMLGRIKKQVFGSRGAK